MGRYAIYGRQKSREEIMAEREEEILKRLENVERLERVILKEKFNISEYNPTPVEKEEKEVSSNNEDEILKKRRHSL